MKNNKTLSYLVFKLVILLLPFAVLIVITFCLDPFRALYYHSDYNKDNFMDNSRGAICYQLYTRNSRTIKYDSFIFGSSRSLAFKVEKYIKYLPSGAIGFHYDASGAGLYDVYNMMRNIDENGGKIKNALIIIEGAGLDKTNNRFGGPLLIAPYQLSKESKLEYYLTYLKPHFNIVFNVAYLDYLLTNKYKKYMSAFFTLKEYRNVLNNITGDFYLGIENKKITDINSLNKYYTDGKFYDRKYIKPYIDAGICDDNNISRKEYPISREEVYLLNKIRLMFFKHNTNYKIVISPLYDQVSLDNGQFKLLLTMFPNSVYNFSGVNKFTESMLNYYDYSHYKTAVADEILDMIHRKKN